MASSKTTLNIHEMITAALLNHLEMCATGIDRVTLTAKFRQMSLTLSSSVGHHLLIGQK
jgi:hypothetical protein